MKTGLLGTKSCAADGSSIHPAPHRSWLAASPDGLVACGLAQPEHHEVELVLRRKDSIATFEVRVAERARRLEPFVGEAVLDSRVDDVPLGRPLVVEAQHHVAGGCARARRSCLSLFTHDDRLGNVVVRHHERRSDEKSGAVGRASLDLHLDTTHAGLGAPERLAPLVDVEEAVGLSNGLLERLARRNGRDETELLCEREQPRVAGRRIAAATHEARSPALGFRELYDVECNLREAVGERDVLEGLAQPVLEQALEPVVVECRAKRIAQLLHLRARQLHACPPCGARQA